MNTMVAVGLLLIKHGVFAACRPSWPTQCCIIIVHSIKYIFMHSVYTLNYNCECFVLFTTVRTSFRRKVLLCLLQVHIFTFYLYFKYIFLEVLLLLLE